MHILWTMVYKSASCLAVIDIRCLEDYSSCEYDIFTMQKTWALKCTKIIKSIPKIVFVRSKYNLFVMIVLLNPIQPVLWNLSVS